MAHTYLLDLYEEIAGRLEEARTELARTDAETPERELARGRMETLRELRVFLSQYNSKLPRRIRARYAGTDRASPAMHPGESPDQSGNC